MCATIRSAEVGTREYLQARTLIVQTEEAARELRDKPNLIFAVRGAAIDAGGILADGHRVIVPIGRDAIKPSSSIALNRPTAYEMGEGLKSMGFSPEEASRRAHECGRSVSILARRIPSTSATRTEWSNDPRLAPIFLAGAWDQSREADRGIITALAGVASYEEVEQSLRGFLTTPDTPVELVGSVWAVRAPVDLFVQISHLLQTGHWTSLKKAVHAVLAERDPALDLPPSERMYASLRGKELAHSSWLRDGFATTLLILAAMGAENEVQPDGRPSQEFVNELVDTIPGLREDHRVIASLSRQLPMLMEAAPHPLFSALEHLLEGDGTKLKPIFQDSREDRSFWSSSPHTGLLWALEVIGQDPKYLQRAAGTLAHLDAIDPGGSLSNRPLGSLRSLFLTWKPATNASHELRLAVLDYLIGAEPGIAWRLVSCLLPGRNEFQVEPAKPQFRELGASEREILTYPIMFETISHIARQAVALAAVDGKRWIELMKEVHRLPPSDRQMVIQAFSSCVERISAAERSGIWKDLSEITRMHRSFSSTDWVLKGNDLETLERIADQLAPQDLGAKDRYLFVEGLPHIPNLVVERVGEQIEELRQRAIKNIISTAGTEGVVRFASEVEEPRYVGGVFGTIAETPQEVMNAIADNDKLSNPTPGFESSGSSAAYMRFEDAWSSLVRSSIEAGAVSLDLMQELVEWWPHAEKTWNWVAQFGEQEERRYWQRRQPWGIQATGKELLYAVDQYLRYERPELIISALSHRASEILADRLIATLTSFEQRVSERPEILRHQSVGYDVQQIFRALQSREEAPLEQIAALEYRYLPLLREPWENTDPDSALDRYLAQSPAFFVQVVADVFRPRSERNQPKSNIPPEGQAKASTGIKLLESFRRIPGLSGGEIDAAVLNQWVQAVQAAAKELDRIEIAEQYIGKLLVHAPIDPTDKVWPHRSVRDGLEKWQSAQIEKGIHIGKMNARGVTSRAPFEGGQQERSLAQQLRADAGRLGRWPRMRGILISLAESWEHWAQQEDIQAEQLRLRE